MRHSPETRARIARGVRRAAEVRREIRRQADEAARQAALVTPADVRHLEESGTVSHALAPFVAEAGHELARLLAGLGGTEAISEQRRLVAEDFARLGIVLRAELARYTQEPSGDAASRLVAVVNSRRSALTTLGLERFARDVDELEGYDAAFVAAAKEPR